MLLVSAAVAGKLLAQSATAPTGAQTPPAATPSPAAAEVQGGTITGTVLALPAESARPATAAKPAPGTPLPGVTVTAANTLTGKKYTAATDITGTFRMSIPRNGRYVLRAEIAAFAPATAEVVLNAAAHTGTASFTLELASRAAQRAANGSTTDVASALQGLGTQALSRGVQALSAAGAGGDAADASTGGGNAGAALPTLGGVSSGGAGGSDSVAISGEAGRTNGLAGLNEDDIRDRIESAIADARRNGGAQADVANAVVGLIGGLAAGGPGGFGGFGGPGGRGGRGGGGGGFRNFNPTQVHGNFFYAGGNAALDATQFSITGNALKPAYSSNRFGGSLSGSPYIPGLSKPSTKQFVFLNVTGQRNSSPTSIFGTVPTAAERAGDFSGLTQTVNGAPTLVPIYDPVTGQPFANNVLNRIDPAAQALLQYLPLPNSVSGTNGSAGIYNYQRVATAGNNALTLASRYVRNFGSSGGPFGGFGPAGGGGRGGSQPSNELRYNLNAGFNYAHNASDIRGFAAPFDGKTLTNGYALNAAFSVGKGRLNHNTAVSWNRSRNTTTNLFTGTAMDPGAPFHVPKPASIVPGFYNGIPTVSLSNFNSLSETNPADRIQQTISLSDSLRWNHKKHNLQIGGDLRRVQNNVIAGTNVVGQFTFTGYATQAPNAGTGTGAVTGQAATGSSFADFLLGAPQQSKIQAGLYKNYLRETVFDAYSQDDWRALAGLTLNFGLRYEYFAPFTELNNHLVNLDHNSAFTAVSPVLPDGVGPLSGAAFPRSLVNPDRTLISPRIGVAYRPKFVKATVLRAGYGINYNTGQFGSFANSLSYQQPFAVVQTNAAFIPGAAPSQGCGNITMPGSGQHGNFTLTNAFNCSAGVSNNFAVNRDYRLGRVQAVNAGVQHTFPLGVVFNADYNGSFGGNLDLLRAPGRSATQLTSNAQAFTYEDSAANSRFQSIILNARKRLQKGVAVQATYQYGHSIDDASSIAGSGGNTVVQNDQRIDLEYGNSTFDVRHRLTGNFVTELPFGPNRLYFAKGNLPSRALDGFSVSGDFTFATGSYATPEYIGSIAQTATGGNYTLRPDRVFTAPISGPRTLTTWFNRNAFAPPAAASGFGDASRNSIELPGTVAFNTTLSRTVSFGELRSFEARATAFNVFNTVQYSGVNTVLNSATFGQVTGTAAPRKLTFQARYRF